MDFTDYPSLGALARLNAQLLADNLAVAVVVETQLDDGERLLRAARDRNWSEVLRLSEQLAEGEHQRIEPAVVQLARNVRDALRRDPSGLKARAPLGDLLAACRDMRRRRQPLA